MSNQQIKKKTTLGRLTEPLMAFIASATSNDGIFLTDNNVPEAYGKRLVICTSMVPDLIDKLKANPSYFKDNNYRTLQVMLDEDYCNWLEKQYNDAGGDNALIHLRTVASYDEKRRAAPRLYSYNGELLHPSDIKKPF